jgi:beta-lactamase regulating signal transducer with metallopeptidase domain
MTWMLANTLGAGMLALLVMLIGRLGKPSPAWMHLLWLAVLVKLALPPLFFFELPVLDAQSSPVQSEVSVASSGFLDQAHASLVVGSRAIESPAALDAAPAGSFDFDFGFGLLLAWALGACLLLAQQIRALQRLRLRWQASAPAPDWLQAECSRLAVILGAPVPQVRLARIGSPFVWGFLRPRLLWPEGELSRGELPRLRAMLAHELAHLRRGDQRLAGLEMLMAMALWWHPLFWFARGRMREQAELCCDAWAVWAVPAARSEYAGALIDAAEKRSPADHVLPALGARPAVRAFEARLLMILHKDTSPKLSRFASLPLGLLALVSISSLSLVEAGSAQSSRLQRMQQASVQNQNQDPAQNQDPKEDRHWVLDFVEDIDLERSTDQLHARIQVGSVEVMAGDEAQVRVKIKVEKDDIAEEDIPDRLSDHLSISQEDGKLILRDLHEGSDDEDAPKYQVEVKLALPRAMAADIGIDVGSVSVNMDRQPDLKVDCNVGSVNIATASCDDDVEIKASTGSVMLSSSEYRGNVKVDVNVGDITFAASSGQGGSIAASADLGSVSGAKAFGLKSKSEGMGASVSGEAGQSSSPQISLKADVGSISLKRSEKR